MFTSLKSAIEAPGRQFLYRAIIVQKREQTRRRRQNRLHEHEALPQLPGWQFALFDNSANGGAQLKPPFPRTNDPAKSPPPRRAMHDTGTPPRCGHTTTAIHDMSKTPSPWACTRRVPRNLASLTHPPMGAFSPAAKYTLWRLRRGVNPFFQPHQRKLRTNWLASLR